MEFLSYLRERFADSRFTTNLIAFYAAIVLIVIAYAILRRLVTHCSGRLSHWTGLNWMNAVGDEAARHTRRLLFWLTALAVVLMIAGGVAYHLAGRDVRVDMRTWYENLTVEELFSLGVKLGGAVGLLIAGSIGIWSLRRVRPYFENRITSAIGLIHNQEALHKWFHLCDQFGAFVIRLVSLWAGFRLIGLAGADDSVLFILYLFGIFACARLLTLGWDAISRTLVDWGDKHFGEGKYHRYWDRVSHLLPFAERCFEAAVYVMAASLAVKMFHFIEFIAYYGEIIVFCIGVIFGTRVLIDLVQVLLNEAFGLYDMDSPHSQKGLTLVPLLQSVCQYVLYFGAAIVIVQKFGINTTPILAGSAVLGLAVGLGAQSLVTDLVSGFFILFEGQYLVGDYVQIGDACGVVETVAIRLTEIRDSHGKLHIIPNGQIKGVINYSKNYINAVVDVKLPSGSDLEGICRAMIDAGKRLKANHKEVLADTVIHGPIDWSPSDMTIRAVTKVKPGAHGAMQSEYRRLLKQIFDQNQLTKTAAKAA